MGRRRPHLTNALPTRSSRLLLAHGSNRFSLIVGGLVVFTPHGEAEARLLLLFGSGALKRTAPAAFLPKGYKITPRRRRMLCSHGYAHHVRAPRVCVVPRFVSFIFRRSARRLSCSSSQVVASSQRLLGVVQFPRYACNSRSGVPSSLPVRRSGEAAAIVARHHSMCTDEEEEATLLLRRPIRQLKR